ncbi:MAG TPA: hypothetical protein VE977_01825, partial [Pyrinomonadaceae bacterium]|nr:hypothetical protein [Pyrinomonadaceae bacterium]
MTQHTLQVIRRNVALILLAVALASAPAQLLGASLARKVRTRENRQAVKPYSSKASKAALAWADKELGRMSLDEKIGQLISVGINATFLNQDSDAFKALRHQVEDNHVGGIILFRGPVYESVILSNRMQELARYPLLIS